MEEYNLIEPAAENWQVLEPSLPLIQLFSSTQTSQTIQTQLDLVSTYAVGIGPSKSDVDAALVEAAHARCLDVHPYTVNETAEMEALIDLGVDGMFTNFSDRLDALLGKKAASGMTGGRLAAEAHTACLEG